MDRILANELDDRVYIRVQEPLLDSPMSVVAPESKGDSKDVSSLAVLAIVSSTAIVATGKRYSEEILSRRTNL